MNDNEAFTRPTYLHISYAKYARVVQKTFYDIYLHPIHRHTKWLYRINCLNENRFLKINIATSYFRYTIDSRLIG